MGRYFRITEIDDATFTRATGEYLDCSQLSILSMVTYMWRSTRKLRARFLSSWRASIMPADTRQTSTQKRPVFRLEVLHMTCRV